MTLVTKLYFLVFGGCVAAYTYYLSVTEEKDNMLWLVGNSIDRIWYNRGEKFYE